MTALEEREDLLAELSGQNRATIGAVLGTGTIGKATERPDGTMEATIRIPEDAMAWEPSILILPHGGTVELTIINDDKNTHACLLPSNGDRQFIGLLNHSKGRATLELDGPGCYWYGSPAGNDEGRGLTAAIVVKGEVPPEAKLDRPAQPRP
ncbi:MULTISPECIES: MSMEG_3727 family PQQ-associated protein [Amycolatopsis methanolica group]|uniref:Multicopper oxidase type 3 n=1 Tax=Amycolatopsis methanolica 239 TaxID=1068978 RepID=A0A076N3V0_AMYME|nr:MSMEG_3727 family PQQ-associated protein [Amycolatopsis methanolica]AIJ24617.1 multicopper oxidase type 3 [Amycolatopsis methanolica 239]